MDETAFPDLGLLDLVIENANGCFFCDPSSNRDIVPKASGTAIATIEPAGSKGRPPARLNPQGKTDEAARRRSCPGVDRSRAAEAALARSGPA